MLYTKVIIDPAPPGQAIRPVLARGFAGSGVIVLLTIGVAISLAGAYEKSSQMMSTPITTISPELKVLARRAMRVEATGVIVPVVGTWAAAWRIMILTLSSRDCVLRVTWCLVFSFLGPLVTAEFEATECMRPCWGHVWGTGTAEIARHFFSIFGRPLAGTHSLSHVRF